MRGYFFKEGLVEVQLETNLGPDDRSQLLPIATHDDVGRSGRQRYRHDAFSDVTLPTLINNYKIKNLVSIVLVEAHGV